MKRLKLLVISMVLTALAGLLGGLGIAGSEGSLQVVQPAPAAVSLTTPTGATKHSLNLSWQQSLDGYFTRYELYRATHPGVTRSDPLAASVSSAAQTSFADTGLGIRVKYYYRVYVVTFGSFYDSGSNEVSGITQGVSYPLSDNVESGAGNWDLDSPWGPTSAHSHSPTTSVTDSPGGSYANNVDVSMTTGIDLSPAVRPVLTFWEKHQIGAGDFGYVEVSVDNGVSWDRVHQASGSQASWAMVSIDLSAYAGKPQVRIRFRLVADGSLVDDGMYIDDVEVAEEVVAQCVFPTSMVKPGWTLVGWACDDPGSPGDLATRLGVSTTVGLVRVLEWDAVSQSFSKSFKSDRPFNTLTALTKWAGYWVFYQPP